MTGEITINLNDIALRKAGRGRQIVHTTERYKNSNDNLADVLLDLMMYATADGKDFEKELETARRWFKQDTAVPASSLPTLDYVRNEFVNCTGVCLQRMVDADLDALAKRFGSPAVADEPDKGYALAYRFKSPWGDPVTLYDRWGQWRIGAKNPDQADLFLKWLEENKLAEGK